MAKPPLVQSWGYPAVQTSILRFDSGIELDLSYETDGGRGSRDITYGSAKRDATGWRQPTAYAVRDVVWSRPKLYSERRMYGDRTSYESGPAEADSLLPPAFSFYPSGIEEAALIKARNRIKDGKLDAAVALGEARKTIDTIGSRLRQIAEGVVGFRKKTPKKLWDAMRRGARKPSAAWLELNYGWVPFLNDIVGGAEYLASINYEDMRVSAHGHCDAETEDWHWMPNSLYPDTGAACMLRKHYGVFVRLDYNFPASFLSDVLKRGSQLGLTNPATLVWELLPFSFVLDWVVPVGSWLSSLDATVGLEYKAGSRTHREMMSADGWTSHIGPGGESYFDQYRLTDPGFLKHKVIQRNPYLHEPYVFHPVLRDPFNARRAVSAVSLLHQAFGHRGPRIGF